MTSSLERHYARSTFLVAGVGVLATGSGRGIGTDDPAAKTGTSDGAMSFAATLVALSAADDRDPETGPRPDRSLVGVA